MARLHLKRFGVIPREGGIEHEIETILRSPNNPVTVKKKFLRNECCFFTACYVGNPHVVKQFINAGCNIMSTTVFDHETVRAFELIPPNVNSLLIKFISEKFVLGVSGDEMIYWLITNKNLEHVKAFFENVKGKEIIAQLLFEFSGCLHEQCESHKHNYNILQVICVYGTPEIFDYMLRLPGVEKLLHSMFNHGSKSYSLASFILGFGRNNNEMVDYFLNGGAEHFLSLKSKYLHRVNDDIFQCIFQCNRRYNNWDDFYTVLPSAIVKKIIIDMASRNMRKLEPDEMVNYAYHRGTDKLRTLIRTCFPAFRTPGYVPDPESTIINADIFVITSAINDNYFEISPKVNKATRFLKIITKLHYDCALVAINRACGFTMDTIPNDEIKISVSVFFKFIS